MWQLAAYVISKNLRRRHLSDSQRASIAGKLTNLGRGRRSKSSTSAAARENPPIGGVSIQQSASLMETPARPTERARLVHQNGIEDRREAVDRDQIPISVAEKIARLPEDE